MDSGPDFHITAADGLYGAFYYDAPNDDSNGTTRYTCRFENEPLSWEMVSDAVCSVGVTLVEIPTTSPTYSLNQTLSRFPSSALAAALLSQVQELIPLVKIQPLQAGDRTRLNSSHIQKSRMPSSA